jgi:MFS family permease
LSQLSKIVETFVTARPCRQYHDRKWNLFRSSRCPSLICTGNPASGFIGFGVLISTAAAGSILGSQCAAWIKNFLGTKKAMLTSMSIVGLSLGLVGVSSHWWMVGALYVVASFFIVVWSVLSLSLRQRVVPNHLQGRVGGTFFLLSWGVSSIGMLFGGLLVILGEWWIDRDFGLRLPNLLFGVVYAMLFFLAFRLFRQNHIDQLASG